MNMKHFFYLLILSLAFSANAQHRISGKIVDEADNGIPSATVQVLNMDSSFVAGSVSDGEGLFVVPEVKEGSYLLSISYIGYVRQLVRVEMPDRDYALPHGHLLHPEERPSARDPGQAIPETCVRRLRSAL